MTRIVVFFALLGSVLFCCCKNSPAPSRSCAELQSEVSRLYEEYDHVCNQATDSIARARGWNHDVTTEAGQNIAWAIEWEVEQMPKAKAIWAKREEKIKMIQEGDCK